MERNNGPRAVTVGHVVAEVMKREGVEVLLTYPLNSLTERCAEVDIRPIVVRQERIGVHMADAIARGFQPPPGFAYFPGPRAHRRTSAHHDTSSYR